MNNKYIEHNILGKESYKVLLNQSLGLGEGREGMTCGNVLTCACKGCPSSFKIT